LPADVWAATNTLACSSNFKIACKWTQVFRYRARKMSSYVTEHKHHLLMVPLGQPFSIFLPWRKPWNNFQVSGNPYIKIIISTDHGTLAWSVSCRYNNPIIVNALLSREWYFSVDLFILANKFKKGCLLFSITISRGTASDISWNPRVPRNPGLEIQL
jgi:hypothetical protein